MRFRSESAVNLRLIAFSLAAGLLGLWVTSLPVAATDSTIGALVCSDDAQDSTITITQPNDDSVVNQAKTTFRGTVENSSQIEVSVDGAYSDTFAIGANQTLFEIEVTLTEGTHTVSMLANNICGMADASDSVVITYTPKATGPTNGGSVPTEVAADKITTTANPNAQRAIDNLFQGVADLPVIGSAVGTAQDFGRSIGLESTLTANSNGSTAATVAGIARVGITVAALVSVVMASSLAPLAVQSVPGVSELFNASSSRSMVYLEWVIRGAGALLFSIAYFL